MNDRRDFLKKSVFLAAGTVAAGSATVFASTAPGDFPSGIVYTKDNPGKWAGKAGSHAPEIKVEGRKVTLTTKHPMSEKHYIARHTLVSADGTVLGSKTFYPSDKEAVSTYLLPYGHGSKLYATSFCNLHDFWVTEFMAK